MHIIRFTDENDKVCYGHKYIDDTAVLLDGHLYNDLKTTGEKTRVKKLLVPVEPDYQSETLSYWGRFSFLR